MGLVASSSCMSARDFEGWVHGVAAAPHYHIRWMQRAAVQTDESATSTVGGGCSCTAYALKPEHKSNGQ